MTTQVLSVVGVDVVIDCAHPGTRELLEAAFGGLQGPRETGAVGHRALRYQVVGPRPDLVGYLLRRDGELVGCPLDDADLVWLLDGDLAVEIQTRRRDLYFVHAAVLEVGGRAFVLAAESGGGKSVTAWAMLHEGFGYLSDEVAPVDLDGLTVHPYPRALCLKDEPASHPVPPGTSRTARTIHVPASHLPGPVVREPLAIAGIFFLRHDRHASAPSVRPISPGEGAARLYANTLNALAHSASGLEGAIQITAGCPCYALTSTELRATAALLRRAAEQTPRPTVRAAVPRASAGSCMTGATSDPVLRDLREDRL